MLAGGAVVSKALEAQSLSEGTKKVCRRPTLPQPFRHFTMANLAGDK